MVTYLGQGADLHMAQLMPLPLTVSCSSKSRLVLPSWFYLSSTGSLGVVLEKIQEGRKTVVCVCAYTGTVTSPREGCKVYCSGYVVCLSVCLNARKPTVFVHVAYSRGSDAD